jgi:hypothetical protein
MQKLRGIQHHVAFSKSRQYRLLFEVGHEWASRKVSLT